MGTPLHMPIFATKCNGTMPAFILGQWWQMFLYWWSYRQPDTVNILIKIDKKIYWKIAASFKLEITETSVQIKDKHDWCYF